jgi:hypothetical protein
LAAGNYRVVTEEELIEDLSFPVYRRVATMIFVPADSKNSGAILLRKNRVDLIDSYPLLQAQVLFRNPRRSPSTDNVQLARYG